MKNRDLSVKIKRLRTEKGLSQESLAGAAGLSLRTIQRIEAGDTEPRGDTLIRIASALGLTTNELSTVAEYEYNGLPAVINFVGIELYFISFARHYCSFNYLDCKRK